MKKNVQQAVVLFLIIIMSSTIGLLHAEAFTLVSESQEIEMGRGIAKEVEKKFKPLKDEALEKRVQKIGMDLAAVSGRPKLPYTFKVLDVKEVNAFALPGGFVYIFKGLVDLMPSDEELAGVMAHEIGHIAKRHSIRQMEKSMGLMVLSLLAFGGKGLEAQTIAIDAIMAGYSRDDEREADNLGFMYTMKATYNPYSTMLGMRKLAETDQPYHYDLFSNHPESQLRVKNIQGYLSDSKVYPKVIELKDGAAKIADGSFELPTLYAEYNGYKPLYRAYFAAGNLYLARKSPNYNADKYILDSDGDNVTVYYDDKAIITLTNQDAAGQNMNIMELAGVYIDWLKNWKRPL